MNQSPTLPSWGQTVSVRRCDRWSIHRRLQELNIPCACPADGTLRVEVNHALALLQNGRLEDAERLLNRLSTAELTPDNRTVLEFGFFELHFRRGNRAAALKSYRNIDPSHLMPPQIRWLEKSYLTLTQ